MNICLDLDQAFLQGHSYSILISTKLHSSFKGTSQEMISKEQTHKIKRDQRNVL